MSDKMDMDRQATESARTKAIDRPVEPDTAAQSVASAIGGAVFLGGEILLGATALVAGAGHLMGEAIVSGKEIVEGIADKAAHETQGQPVDLHNTGGLPDEWVQNAGGIPNEWLSNQPPQNPGNVSLPASGAPSDPSGHHVDGDSNVSLDPSGHHVDGDSNMAVDPSGHDNFTSDHTSHSEFDPPAH